MNPEPAFPHDSAPAPAENRVFVPSGMLPDGQARMTRTGAQPADGHGSRGTSHDTGVPDGHLHDDDHSPLDPMDVRVRALETLLVAQGHVDPAAIDRLIETYETRVGPHHGAAVVARAWADASFRAWLARDATAAIASMGFSGRQGEHMVAVFNSPQEHHLVVCTLCSCYPWPVLGLPPVWYKSAPYRSRAVREPRAVLADFGLRLPEATRVRVWDSTAEIRYLVVPMRPAATEGWDEARLARLVTRDSMIGTGLALAPEAARDAEPTGGPQAAAADVHRPGAEAP